MTNSTKTVRVGVMPGRINEFAVEIGATIESVLTLAELSATGFEVKVDGAKVTDLSQTVTSSTNLILLAKQVKGNAEKTIRVGVMPGRINEFVVDSSTSIQDVLNLAELSSTGFEVKVDGTKATDLTQPVGSANLILLAKQVKGNAEKTVRVGVMPGRINEFVVEDTATIESVLTLAELSATGFEVKVDGTKVTDLNTQVGSANLILLAKQVKGNK